MLSAGPATTNSRGDHGGERQPGPASRLVLAGIVVGLLGVLVLGVAAGPAAGQSEGNISAPAIAYTVTDGGSVHLVDDDGDTVDTGVNANIIGPVADMDKDGTLDVTAVNSNGDIILIPAVSGATPTTLVSDATKRDPASRTIAIGDVDGDGDVAVLYSNQSDDNYLYRVEPGESPRSIYRGEGGEGTQGALGHGDFTNDGTSETLFRGSSEEIKWINGSGTVGKTGTSGYGTNNGIGLGPLTDYDGDGENRVSAIDESNRPALINSSSGFYRPDSNYQIAAKTSVAAADLTDDGDLEIVHRSTDDDGGTVYYMTTGGANEEYEPNNEPIAVSDQQGLSGTGVANRLDATAADYVSVPNVTVDRPIDGETYTSSEVLLNASADETSDWSYSVDGGDKQTVTGANGTRTLNTTLSSLNEGQHNVTVYAENRSGSGVGTASASFTVDTTAPSISSFNTSNPEGQDVSVSFDSDEDLTNVSVDLSGPESTTLTRSDFDESGDTYTATYGGNSDGDYTATLETAEDAAGNDGAAGQSDTTNIDTTAPTISDGSFTATNPEGQDVSVSFDSNEAVNNISVNLTGPENATLTEDDFTESGGTYNATYDGNSDGNYTATLETAEDADGNDGAGGQSDTTTVDTTAPTISDDSFTATNPEGQDVSVSFNSTETLTDIRVNLTGPESTDLTEGDFARDGNTYNATYDGNSDGNYTATLEMAEDTAGNDGAAGQSDTTTVDTTPPTISNDSFTVTNEEQNVSVSFDSNEAVTDIRVNLTGPENEGATLTRDDFTESGDTYTATYEGDSDGNYTATLETAEDAAGNDGADGQSDTTTVDTVAPTIPADSFTVTNPEDQDILVRIDSDEPLEDIDVDITGSENATLTESDFTGDNGTYTAIYEGDSEGNYTAILEIADDAAGNDGATGQNDTTTVDTFFFGDESSDGGFADGVDSEPDGEGTVVNAESVSPGDSETDRTPEAYVNVSNPEPGQTLLINETGAVVLENETSVDGNVPENETALADSDATPVANILPELLLVETNTSDDFELSVRAYEDDLTPSRTLMSVEPESARADRPEDAEAIRSAAGSFESETDTVAAGYVSINTTLASEEVDGATFQFSVRREYLETLGVAPEEVTLYRQVDDEEWEANETTYLGTVGNYYRYETEIPEVTTLALSTSVPTTEVTDASLEQTTIETGEEAVVTATVANRGRTATGRTVRLTRDGDTVDTATVEVEGNETTTATLAYTPNSTGEYNLSVESTDLETLTVETDAGPAETGGTGTDGDGPGFGVGVALAALCGAGYMLRRRDGPV